MRGALGLTLAGLLLYVIANREKLEKEKAQPEVRVGGSVGSIQVSLGQTATLEKKIGALFLASAGWQATTKDFEGTPILWPYRLAWRFGHSTLAGWKTVEELGFGQPGVKYYPTEDGAWVTGMQRLALMGWAVPDDDGQLWDIHVTLESQTSMSGKPSGKWDLVLGSEVKANSVIKGVKVSTEAAVSGSVGSVTVGLKRHIASRMGL